MIDFHDTDAQSRPNIEKIPDRAVAAAIAYDKSGQDLPRVTAAGRGKIAQQILEVAWAHGIKVRQDGPLAQMLAAVELDTPIPSEAFMAVAEILSYVYRANNAVNPFDAVLAEE